MILNRNLKHLMKNANIIKENETFNFKENFRRKEILNKEVIFHEKSINLKALIAPVSI